MCEFKRLHVDVNKFGYFVHYSFSSYSLSLHVRLKRARKLFLKSFSSSAHEETTTNRCINPSALSNSPVYSKQAHPGKSDILR